MTKQPMLHALSGLDADQLMVVTGGYISMSPDRYLELSQKCPATMAGLKSGNEGFTIRDRLAIWDPIDKNFDDRALALRCGEEIQKKK